MDEEFEPGCEPECEDCKCRIVLVDEVGTSYECSEDVCIYEFEV